MGLEARLSAARQLEQDEQRGAYTGHSRRGQGGDPVDERQITDLVSGVVRWRRYLDFLIASFYKGDAEKLEVPLRTVLRLGLFELLLSDTASHAAVNETVELARRHAHPRVTGLVNGILRSAQRADALPMPATGDRARDLAIRYSHPDWMVRRWLSRWPEEDVIALLEYNNTRPSFSVLDVDKMTFERTTSVQSLVRSGDLSAGRVRIQDEGAAHVVHVMAPEPGMTVLDMCAAPGGKAIYTGLLMNASGRVVATDIHRNRVKLIDQGAREVGLDNVETRVMDALHPDADLLDACDIVLIDAPCSGLGVLSKRADMRWQRTETDLVELVALQRKMLQSAARCVRPGGVLIYSTCTTEPDENELQVADFLAAHPEFERDPVAADVPLTGAGDYLSLPHVSGYDGAYAARLRRGAKGQSTSPRNL